MRGTVADALRKQGYVLEACSGNKTLTFELWANYRARGAAVAWTSLGRKPQTSVANWLRPAPPQQSGVVLSSSVPDGVAVTTGWLGCLCDMGRAFELAFPEDGACYPDVLTRAFAAAMRCFDVEPMGVTE